MSLLAYGLSGMVAVDSSFIAAVGYHPRGGTLVVLMHSGQSYTYHGVPSSLYAGLLQSSSVGSSVGAYYNACIKGRYP